VYHTEVSIPPDNSLHSLTLTHLDGTQSYTAPRTTPGTLPAGSARMHARRSHPRTRPWGSPRNRLPTDGARTTPPASH
jgi:hypothetical protein